MVLESVVAGVLNRFLGLYFEGVDSKDLKFGIFSGSTKLSNLKLKKEALDKFHLPIDVKEGFLGELTLSVPWSNLKGKPVQVLIENLYLLATLASPDAHYDPEDEARRAQAVKMEKLQSAELLTTKPSAGMSAADEAKNESFVSSLINRIVDNIQITVKNVHIRYEDNVSVPGHSFAAGFTLAGFSVRSADEKWTPTFIVDSKQGIHKIASLDSMAIYFDSNAGSLAGRPPSEATGLFNEAIGKSDSDGAESVGKPLHQYILAPVSGEGRLVMYHHIKKDTPKMDAELLFKELAFAIDDEQYRDALSMLDLVHFYTRRNQYQKYRPQTQQLEANKSRALFHFAQTAILQEVKERHRKWTWDYFRERRDDRKLYIYSFKLQARNESTPEDKRTLEELEQKLSYPDIRFYRSIARSELRKDKAAANRTAQQKELQDGPQGKGKSSSSSGWLGWVWGGSKTDAHKKDEQPQDLLSDEQRKELYDAIDWDESQPIKADYDLPKETMKARVKAKLDTGSFTLRRDPHGRQSELIKVVFDAFSADVLQRPDNLEAVLALQSMSVTDGTLDNSLHKQIVRVKQTSNFTDGDFIIHPSDRPVDTAQHAIAETDVADSKDEPFFYIKFEQKPLDEKADTALTVRMRYMEVVYHRGYVEEIVRFFKPPASHLESVNALVEAASQTLDGIRKETRAGLEFALQSHKTVNLQVDMNAPIIIIPEDVTKATCQHVVLDAGYIKVESNLVPQQKLAEIRSKERQHYTDRDFEQLEALMYDSYHVALKQAQLLMGPSLDDCMKLLSEERSDPHINILEQININFQAETCIVQNAPNLTRLRVSGGLQDLHVHLSDRKYKSLMRMIDVALPKFDSAEDTSLANVSRPVPKPDQPNAASPASLRRESNAFRTAPLYLDDDDALSLGEETDVEYEDEQGESTAVDTDDQGGEDKENNEDEQFYDPGDIVEGNSNYLQKTFEFKFRVEKLQASIYKSDPFVDNIDRLLVNTSLTAFDFAFALRPYDMEVALSLGAFIIDDCMVEPSSQFRQLVSSGAHGGSSTPTDLVRIKYARVQPDSPDFMTVHEGNNQSVDVELSTITLTVTRASILMLFDWIMTTFASGNSSQTQVQIDKSAESLEQSTSANFKAITAQDATPEAAGPIEKLRVKVKLSEVRAILNDDGTQLATLSLQAADVAILLRGPTMRVAARLGNLSLTDDCSNVDYTAYRQLLSIDGDNLADFQYEKYDPEDSANRTYDSLVYLRSGSFKFVFMEEPMHRILRFLTKFGRMKAIYDATTAAAAQQAAELQNQVNRMHYDILVHTPIVVFPRHPQSLDSIVANLGEISLKNRFSRKDESSLTYITAALSKIRLSSSLDVGGQKNDLNMLNDVDLKFEISMLDVGSGEKRVGSKPDTEIIGKLSDVRMHLTAAQYAFLMDLSKTIPRTFAATEDEILEDEKLEAQLPAPLPTAISTKLPVEKSEHHESETVDLFPELAKVAINEQGEKVPLFSKLEFSFAVKTIYLEIYTDHAFSIDTLKSNSLARFSLNETDIKYKMVSNGSMEAEVLLRSFTVHDTRPENETCFREIIPASKEKGFQLMASYAMSGGSDKNAVANVTVDTPSLIFSLDPLFAMLDFAMTPFRTDAGAQGPVEVDNLNAADNAQTVSESQTTGSLAFRVNIVAASIKLLADPTRTDSEAIVLSIRQVQLAQQGTLVLSVDHLGIFLCKMDKQKETARILDDFDINLSMDNRQENGGRNSSIELDVQMIILRLSNRDVGLVSSIVSRAIELSSSGAERPKDLAKVDELAAPNATGKQDQGKQQRRVSTPARPDQAELIVTRETLRAAFGGFRMVLISDLHEMPMLDVRAAKFTARVEDWSADMKAGVRIAPTINYYNLLNSRWETLMEPWDFSIQATKASARQSMAIAVTSKRRLELNVTHTFVDLAITTLTLYSKMHEDVLSTSRGSSAPFLIRNRTGHPITFWAETGNRNASAAGKRLEDGGEAHWRLDDWRTMRESATTSVVHNSVGLRLDHTAWEPVKHISVEREGEQIYRLKPKLDRITHRVLCECKLVDNVKVVTFRSTFKVENLTLVPSEMVIIDENNKRASPTFKIAPGEECSVPIEAAYHQRIRFRPDPGFGHAWSQGAYRWKDFMSRPAQVVTCRSIERDSAFRFQAFAEYDIRDPILRTYPKLTLRLRAPLEIENLLPYDIRFRMYDKNREHNWSSFLRKGGISPVHSAELSHLLLLSIEIQDSPFKRSEFSIINTDNPDDLPVEDSLQLEDRDGLKLDLRLHYERFPTSGGAFKVQIYSPYIVRNKTELDFALRAKTTLSSAKSVAGLECLSQDERKNGSIPFLFSFGSRDARNRVLLQVHNAQWSAPMSFETIGTDTEIILSSASGSETIRIGVNVTEGTGNYKLTKVITFYPRFVIKNSLRFPVTVRPSSMTYDVILQPDERASLHWLPKTDDPLLVVRRPNIQKWTPAVRMLNIGETYLRLWDEQDGHSLIRADVALSGPVVFITIVHEDRGAPMLIRNMTDHHFEITQGTQAIVRGTVTKRPRYKVAPHSELEYVWDEPSAANKELRLDGPDGQSRNLNIMEIGSLVPFKFSTGRTVKEVSLDISAEGHCQILQISPFDEYSSLYRLQRRDTSMSMTRTSSQSSATAEYEVKESALPITFSIALSFEGLGVSVINARMVELLYASFRGIKFSYGDSANSQSVSFSIHWIQMDNQLFGCMYPQLLYPTEINGNDVEVQPNLQASVVLMKDKAHGVLYFKYASILLQKMALQVDEDFLYGLMDFSKFRGTADATVASQLFSSESDLPDAPTAVQSTEVYFEDLQLQPVQIDVSFMRTERLSSEQDIFAGNRNAVAYFLNAVTMAIGNVNEAPIRLNALIINDVRLSFAVLAQRIMLHYRQGITSQVYRVVGSADFLGNPIGLFSNVSSGVADLFYEPTEGVVEFRDFGAGLARGAGSFVKKTVFGVTDSVTKVTGSIGKGLSAATLDKRFQSQRRIRQHRNKPRHALYGFASGTGSFLNSVGSGITGLVTQPVDGAEASGASGFVKGLGKGVVGLATKPMVGIFDMASNISEGIRNTTTVFEQSPIDRVRLPRLIPADKVLRPYNEREAIGQFWLKNLENSKYFNEHYVAHIEIKPGGADDVIIVTTESIISARISKLRSVWHISLADLQSISLEDKGIALLRRDGANGPFIRLEEQEGRLWLFSHIERVVIAYNNQRRLE